MVCPWCRQLRAYARRCEDNADRCEAVAALHTDEEHTFNWLAGKAETYRECATAIRQALPLDTETML